MAALLRPLKEGSVRTYQEKVTLGFSDILASEADADFDTIYAAWNGPAGGDLQGNYPAPTVIPAVKSKWTVSGATLTPIDATKGITLSQGIILSADNDPQIVMGVGPLKGGLTGTGSATTAFAGLVANHPFAPQDVSKAGWKFELDVGNDELHVWRKAPGAAAGTVTMPLRLEGVGKLTLASTGDPLIVLGGGTQKAGIGVAADQVNLVHNHPWAPQDVSKAGWSLALNTTVDEFEVWHKAAGASAGTVTMPFKVTGIGDLQISGNTAYKATGTTWSNPSDDRVKKDAAPYTSGLAAILALDPITFRYNGKGGSTDDLPGIGFSAQSVQPVMPEMVLTYQAKLDPEDTEATELLALDTTALPLALVNAVKELAARVSALEAR